MTDQARTIRTGQDMRAARQPMGITQQDAALIMGMSQPSYNATECGARTPTKQQRAAFAMMIRLHDLGALDLHLQQIKKNEMNQK